MSDPIKTNDFRILVHYLCNMEYTGKIYRGSRKSFSAKLNRYIEQHRDGNKWFTAEEDKQIMASKNLAETARQMGRSYDSVYARCAGLRRRVQNDQS